MFVVFFFCFRFNFKFYFQKFKSKRMAIYTKEIYIYKIIHILGAGLKFNQFNFANGFIIWCGYYSIVYTFMERNNVRNDCNKKIIFRILFRMFSWWVSGRIISVQCNVCFTCDWNVIHIKSVEYWWNTSPLCEPATYFNCIRCCIVDMYCKYVCMYLSCV